MMSPEWRVLRARIAGKKRQDPNADVSEERRELHALRLEEHIRRFVAEAPAPTAEQARRLRALLAPTNERGTAA